MNENETKKEPNKLEDVPSIFFEAKTPEDCVLNVLSQLPPIFDPTFLDSLNSQIEIAESSIGVVTEELTKKVFASQNEIFDATSRFLSLEEEVSKSAKYISSMRNEIDAVRDKTLNPMVDIYTHIRDVKRDTMNLICLHFAQSMLLIDENLHSRQFIISAYNYRCARELLENEEIVYSDDLYNHFFSINFPKLIIDYSNLEVNLTIGELKQLACIKDILESINEFPKSIETTLSKEIEVLAETFNESKYVEVLMAFCLISDAPPISQIIVDKYTQLLHSRAVAYFESLSDDLDTLFRFMDTNCALLTRFQVFTNFHKDNPHFSDLTKYLPEETSFPSLQSIFTSQDEADKILVNLQNSFINGYEKFSRTAESNVLQFLSRLNCTSLDALSFIQLFRGLREFSSILSCSGLQDWQNITSTEYMQKYTQVCLTSCRTLIINDSWAPVSVEKELIQHIQTKPNPDADIFHFNQDVDPTKRYASQSAIQTVRIIHSLICLSQELDQQTCFNLIVQVASSYFATLVNNFCNPYTLLFINEQGQVMIHPKLSKLFTLQFINDLKDLLRILGHLALPDQKPIESSESHLMQMIVGTEGLKLISWYLDGIRKYMEETNIPSQQIREKIQKFFSVTFNSLFPTVRMNLASVCAKNFLSLKQLKYQIIAQDWNVQEITIECHSFCAISKKYFEQLDKTLQAFQLSEDTLKDIWCGASIRVANVLIHGFGSVRNCNSNGRSLMLGDTRAVSNHFQAISKIDVDTSKVMEFINAFFFKPQEYSKWIEKAILDYKYTYLLNLTKTGLNCRLSAKEIKDLTSKIEQFHNSLLSQTQRK